MLTQARNVESSLLLWCENGGHGLEQIVLRQYRC